MRFAHPKSPIYADFAEKMPNIYLKPLLFLRNLRHYGYMAKPTHLDDVSRAIIEQLQEDGRRPYASIGKAVGLSEAAVRQRVSRLTDSGVMQIVAVTDPLQVGFNRAAMIGIEVEGDIEKVAQALSKFPETDYVVITAGSFDILCEVVCDDDDSLLELINRRIRALPGVRRTESFMYLTFAKHVYTYGTR